MNQIDFSMDIGYLAVFLGFFLILMAPLIRSSYAKTDKRFLGGVEKNIDLSDIKVISLRPGSLLIVKVHQEINQKVIDELNASVLSKMPPGVKVFVMGRNMDIYAVLEDCSSNTEPISNARGED